MEHMQKENKFGLVQALSLNSGLKRKEMKGGEIERMAYTI